MNMKKSTNSESYSERFNDVPAMSARALGIIGGVGGLLLGMAAFVFAPANPSFLVLLGAVLGPIAGPFVGAAVGAAIGYYGTKAVLKVMDGGTGATFRRITSPFRKRFSLKGISRPAETKVSSFEVSGVKKHFDAATDVSAGNDNKLVAGQQQTAPAIKLVR
jgi:hypothetical protein